MEGSNLFNSFYYKHNCGMAYERNEAWLAAFDRIAERIVSDIHPETVLDAGCAMGMLVERLRARGVKAWGIDISEYAISQVAPEIKDYCWVGSIIDPLPDRYDLIVSIEVLEHIPEEGSLQALNRLCQHTDNLLVSISHGDFKEVTHLNVQPPEYWTRHFYRNGFYHDVDFDAGFITPWAAYYRRHNTPIAALAAYERKINLLLLENKELRQAMIDMHKKLERYEDEGIIDGLQAQINALEARWADLETGATWKALKKIQNIRTALIPPGSGRERLLDRLKGAKPDKEV